MASRNNPFAYLSSLSIIQHLLPTLFILWGISLGLPQFLLWALTHPSSYLSSSALNDPNSLDHTSIDILRRKFFSYVYAKMSPVMDIQDAPIKAPLLKKARGVVLEIGPGVGDNVKYYEREKVERLVLVEPNVHMHDTLRSNCAKAGFREDEGTLRILSCGASPSDLPKLRSGGLTEGSVDTVVLIHVMCGIPQPSESIEMYYAMLKSGGLMVWYEHVANEEDESGWTRWVQHLYTEWVWRGLFDGCELDRPTAGWIVNGMEGEVGSGNYGKGQRYGEGTGLSLAEEMNALRNRGAKLGAGGRREGRWREFVAETPEGQQRYSCLPHVLGWAVKV